MVGSLPSQGHCIPSNLYIISTNRKSIYSWNVTKINWVIDYREYNHKQNSKQIKQQRIYDHQQKDVSSTGHNDDVVKLSTIISGLLLQTFKTREALPLMKRFNPYIRRKQQTTSQYGILGRKRILACCMEFRIILQVRLKVQRKVCHNKFLTSNRRYQ